MLDTAVGIVSLAVVLLLIALLVVVGLLWLGAAAGSVVIGGVLLKSLWDGLRGSRPLAEDE
jgi:hypothetical protein